MTRQPALEKRITVACPMPRLAPVRSSVRRGVLAEFGINGSLVLRHARPCAGHPRLEACCEQDVDGGGEGGPPPLNPWRTRRPAGEFDAVVRAEGGVVPELDRRGRDAPAAPAGRARHLADDVL